MSYPILPMPDAHGEAALLLAESVIHALLAKSVLSVHEAIEIVEVAVDAQGQIADLRGDDFAQVSPSAHLLTAIRDTLAIDARRADTPAD